MTFLKASSDCINVILKTKSTQILSSIWNWSNFFKIIFLKGIDFALIHSAFAIVSAYYNNLILNCYFFVELPFKEHHQPLLFSRTSDQKVVLSSALMHISSTEYNSLVDLELRSPPVPLILYSLFNKSFTFSQEVI